MLESSIPDDPWETPPVHLDPELVETSQQLMAKSNPAVQPELDPPEVTQDAKDLQILQLAQENQRLFNRNVSLVAEVAHLRAVNQRLLEQVSELKQQSQTAPNWLLRFLQQFSK